MTKLINQICWTILMLLMLPIIALGLRAISDRANGANITISTTLATESWGLPQSDKQAKVDSNLGLIINNQTGCNGVIYITSHNYKALGKEILNLSVGEHITYNGCIFKAVSRNLIDTKVHKHVFTTGMVLQTCSMQSNDLVYLIEAKQLKKRKLFSS